MGLSLKKINEEALSTTNEMASYLDQNSISKNSYKDNNTNINIKKDTNRKVKDFKTKK